MKIQLDYIFLAHIKEDHELQWQCKGSERGAGFTANPLDQKGIKTSDRQSDSSSALYTRVCTPVHVIRETTKGKAKPSLEVRV
jgi:hypothetical protein